MIYIAIIEDRHTDVTVHPFSTADRAIAYARQVAGDYCSLPGGVDESENDIDGWVYNARYSEEGDAVRVVACTVDAV